jgi:hypothetical protein
LLSAVEEPLILVVSGTPDVLAGEKVLMLSRRASGMVYERSSDAAGSVW